MQKMQLQKKTFLPFGLIGFLVLFLSSCVLPVNATFSQGDTIVWGTGEGRSTTGYVKATYNYLSNTSIVFVDFQEFDLYGENKSSLVSNITMTNYWVSEVNATQYAANNNYAEETITLLEEEIHCVIIERNNGGVMTSLYYDIATGVMVQTIMDGGGFIRIISWTDIDVKVYAEELNAGIPGYGFPILFGVSFLAIIVVFGFVQKKSPIR